MSFAEPFDSLSLASPYRDMDMETDTETETESERGKGISRGKGTCGNRIASPFVPWRLPDSLRALEDWLRLRGVNVDDIKSDRHALHIAAQLTRKAVKWPANGKSALPALATLQKRFGLKSPSRRKRENGRKSGVTALTAYPVRVLGHEEIAAHAARLGVAASPSLRADTEQFDGGHEIKVVSCYHMPKGRPNAF